MMTERSRHGVTPRGRHIMARLKALNMTQADLARKLAVTRGAVWHWIHREDRYPTSGKMRPLAKLLGTTVSNLHRERGAA